MASVIRPRFSKGMTLNDYINGAVQREQRRPLPLGVSAILHVMAFFLLLHAPAVRLPPPSKSAYQLAISGKETKLVWYKFEKKLPAVRPLEAKAERRPVRAEFKAPQAMVASRRDAPKRKQVVWTPAPELREAKPLDLPNILAIRMPEITRPFVAPQIKPPDAARPSVPADAPQLQAKLEAVKLTDEQRVTKKFVPPPRKAPEKLTQVVAPADAPRIETSAVKATVLNADFKTPTRPFTAPPVQASAAIKQPTLEAPPDPIANSHDLTTVVAGLNPSVTPPVLPVNSSPARFSAGPKVRPEGADAAGDGKALTVPDLYVAGPKNDKDIKTELLAQAFAAPTSPLSLRAAARMSNPNPPAAPEKASPGSLGGAVKVSGAPDKRFDGRDVYMMAIQMPNLTSWSGSWLMWYADRTARKAGEFPISPPVAHRKVDPKYVASARADGVEGTIRLACIIGIDGHVYNIEMVRGLDDRLNATAEEALSKWEFTPASRQGIPVEVDVLVEIPFRLEHTLK